MLALGVMMAISPGLALLSEVEPFEDRLASENVLAWEDPNRRSSIDASLLLRSHGNAELSSWPSLSPKPNLDGDSTRTLLSSPSPTTSKSGFNLAGVFLSLLSSLTEICRTIDVAPFVFSAIFLYLSKNGNFPDEPVWLVLSVEAAGDPASIVEVELFLAGLGRTAWSAVEGTSKNEAF